MRIVSNNKLICFSDSFYLYSKGPRLYCSKAADGQQHYIGSLPVGCLKSALGKIRLMTRALRLEVRCGIFVDESIALLSYHGAVYRVDCTQGTIELEHKYRPEMNNPLCFTKLEGIPGFTDGIYYGEYYLNHAGTEVNIYRRDASGNWSVVFTYPSGSIYHIHGIVPCKSRKCVYVLTGDKDFESGIFECREDFSEVKAVVTGKQSYRACVALPTEDGLLYTTDTPLEDNYLYHLNLNTKQIKKVMELAGPSIYGKVLNDNEFVFSTSVEPDSRITGLQYEFTNKLGAGVKDRCTHIYHVKVSGADILASEIFAAKKDFLPMGAFQFGTMMFPAGGEKIFVTGQSVRKYDNKTIEFELGK